jgi:hypothetical protein
MAVFQHVLWGYELSYPEDWIYKSLGDVEGFALISEALTPEYAGPQSGQVLVRVEWNCARQPIEPIWNRHIGMLASWLGAKQVGAAPWHMGGAIGIEAEIVLPKKDQRRLWTGILERGMTVLNFVVLHLKEEREIYQTAATKIISSLRFPAEMAGVLIDESGLLLPPGYGSISVGEVLDDVNDPERWRAFDGASDVGALQAFFLREAPNHGWSIEEYVPFPSPAELGFARLRMEKDGRKITLGIMPYQAKGNQKSSPGRLVFKLE